MTNTLIDITCIAAAIGIVALLFGIAFAAGFRR